MGLPIFSASATTSSRGCGCLAATGNQGTTTFSIFTSGSKIVLIGFLKKETEKNVIIDLH
jgi:hypothetical protein